MLAPLVLMLSIGGVTVEILGEEVAEGHPVFAPNMFIVVQPEFIFVASVDWSKIRQRFEEEPEQRIHGREGGIVGPSEYFDLPVRWWSEVIVPDGGPRPNPRSGEIFKDWAQPQRGPSTWLSIKFH